MYVRPETGKVNRHISTTYPEKKHNLSVGYYLTTLSEVLCEVGTLSNFLLQSFSKHLAKPY